MLSLPARPTPLAQSAPVRGRLAGKKILLIDDSPDICRLFCRLLEFDGATVQAVVDPEHGITLALEEHYDLILMDLQMPSLSGTEAAQALRQAGCLYPLVAISGHAEGSYRKAALAAGFNGFLLKGGNCLDFVQQLSPWI